MLVDYTFSICLRLLNLVYPDDEAINVDGFYPLIVLEAKKVIEWLDNNKIIITGHSGEYQGIEYVDNRRVDEIQSKIPLRAI